MGIMAKTDLTNQRQVFVEQYVRSGNHLEAAKKAGYKDTHTLRNQGLTMSRDLYYNITVVHYENITSNSLCAI